MRALAFLVLAGCGSTQLGEPVRGEAIEVEIASITLVEPGTLDECVPECTDAARLQLSVRSSDARAFPIKVTKVELFDAAGASVATLPASAPKRWNAEGLLAPWNEQVGGGEILAATYTLGAPTWVAGGHYDRTASYRVKVSVTVGSKQRTVEKLATVMSQQR